MDYDDPRAEEALLSREQDMREDGRWGTRYRTRIGEHEPSFGDPERAAPGPDEEDAARLAAQAIEGPLALLPGAELFFASAAKTVALVRRDSTSTKGLDAARAAARLAATLLDRLLVELEAALDDRARRWPLECGCGAVHTRDSWQRLRFVGMQRDPAGDLEMRLCGCGSTRAMPVPVGAR